MGMVTVDEMRIDDGKLIHIIFIECLKVIIIVGAIGLSLKKSACFWQQTKG